MNARAAVAIAVLAGAPLVLGACGPTTDVYLVNGSQLPVARSTPLEIDVEDCQPGRASAPTSSAEQQGFVEIGRDCQLPIHWITRREPGASLRRFALLGGPYPCTIDLSARKVGSIQGIVVGDALSLTVTFDSNEVVAPGVAPADVTLFPIFQHAVALPEPPQPQLQFQGIHDDSHASRMICGMPEVAFAAAPKH